MQSADELHDRQILCIERFNERVRNSLKPLVTDAIIEEHRRNPVGQHGDALERLLNYFRRSDVTGKYALLAVEPFAKYRIVRLSGRRGVPPEAVDDIDYSSPEEAYHAVFLKRIKDLLES